MDGAFIKTREDRWDYSFDLEVILNTDAECIFAKTAEEAVDILNENHNPYWPDLHIYYVQKYYGQMDSKTIAKWNTPRVIKTDILFIDFLDLLKRVEVEVYVENWQDIKRWKEEIGEDKHFNDFGIVNTYSSDFKYSPALARQEKEERIEKEKNRHKEPPRKNKYIYHWEIDSLQASLRNNLSRNIWELYRIENKHVSISSNYQYYNRDKRSLCKQILEYVETYEEFFGKGSYRKIEEFQRLKLKWKKHKPTSAKSISVTQKFFDFMQEEIKFRKPTGKLKARRKNIVCKK